jgi:hypothetical protein
MPFDVAVVVPTFNRAELLRQTVDAVLSQTHRPAEVVVVDDGGSDHTEQVVTGFGPPVKYARVPNGGPSAARNAGVTASSAEWIALCDDDDLWRPNYLERMAAASERFPEAEFLFSDFTFVKDGVWTGESKFATAPPGYWDGDVQVDGPFRLLRDSMVARSVRWQTVFVSCMVFRRSLFDHVGGYDPAFSRLGAEDWEFTLRAVAGGSVVAVAEPLVGIRKHPGSVSTGVLKVLEGEVAILRHAMAHHAGAAEHRELIEAEIGKRTLAAAEVAFDQERFDLVRELAKAVPAGLRHNKLKLKAMIAGLPTGLARWLKRRVSG